MHVPHMLTIASIVSVALQYLSQVGFNLTDPVDRDTVEPSTCRRVSEEVQPQQIFVQGLWYFVQPPLASLGLSAAIASEAISRELRGAPLLNMLHAKAASVSGQSPPFSEPSSSL